MINFEKIIGVNQSYRMVKRNLFIFKTISHFGFNDMRSRWSHRAHFLRFFNSRAAKVEKEPLESRLRRLLEALGPTFVKLGQILSTRGDLLPPPYLKELSKLQDNVAPFSYAQAKLVIESELGQPIEKLFKSFEQKPIAAASIGQAHRAVTHDGEQVIVKIQRPGVVKTIQTDLALLKQYARYFAARMPTLAVMRPEKIVEEFSHSLNNELDYRVEAAFATHFKAIMATQEGIYVPRVYDDLSTSKVLTIEEVHGNSARKILENVELQKGLDLQVIAERGARSVLAQIFEFGFFHADPHPGNIFITEDKLLAFIDFGMMGHITESERLNFVNCIDFMIKGDITSMTEYVIKLTHVTQRPDMDLLSRDIGELVDANIHLSMKKMNLGHILERLQHILNHHHIALRPNLYMMFKSVITIESLARSFYPDMAIVEIAKPFITKLKMRALNPIPIMKRIKDHLSENLDYLTVMPQIIHEILRKTSEDELTVRFEHRGLERFDKTFKIVCDRIVVALVISALIIGSSLIFHAKLPPLWNGMPVIGVCGFLLSGLMGLLLLIGIYRSNSNDL